MPLSTIYSVTKAFNDFLSHEIAPEVDTKVNSLSVRPLYVITPHTKMEVKGFTITLEQSVEGTLNDLGYELITCGHWLHKI